MKIFAKPTKKEMILIVALIIFGVVTDYYGLFKEMFIDESDTKSCRQLLKEDNPREITLIDRTKCTWGRDILRYNIIDEDGDKMGIYCLSTDFNTIAFSKIREKEITCENFDDAFERADNASDEDDDTNSLQMLRNALTQDIYFKTQTDDDFERMAKTALIQRYPWAKNVNIQFCEHTQDINTAIISFDIDDKKYIRIWDSKSNEITESKDEELNQDIKDGSCPTTESWQISAILDRDNSMRKAMSSFSNSGEVRLIPEYGYTGMNMDKGAVSAESYQTNCKIPDYNLPIKYSKLITSTMGTTSYLQQFSAGKYKFIISLAEITPEDDNESNNYDPYEKAYERAIDPTELSCMELAQLVAGAVVAGQDYGDEQVLFLSHAGLNSAAEIYKILKKFAENM